MDFFTHLSRKAKNPASSENVGSVLSPPAGRLRRASGERIYGSTSADLIYYLSLEATPERCCQKAEMGTWTSEDTGCPGFPARIKANQRQNQPYPSLADVLGSLSRWCINDANFQMHLRVLGCFSSASFTPHLHECYIDRHKKPTSEAGIYQRNTPFCGLRIETYILLGNSVTRGAQEEITILPNIFSPVCSGGIAGSFFQVAEQSLEILRFPKQAAGLIPQFVYRLGFQVE
jgi:hypothetical protein